jgi:SagB-type dehydrogenase family enzyme
MPILWDVEGLSPGAYRYEPETHSLLPVPLDGSVAVLRTLFLQQEHQSASVVLILAAPMSAWLAREGERGYRAMALQIGMLTDILYLVAEALGLTYTASGGFPPASIDAALGLNGVTHTAFFSFVIGGPRP